MTSSSKIRAWLQKPIPFGLTGQGLRGHLPSALPFIEQGKLTLSIEGSVLKVMSYTGKKVTGWVNFPFSPALVNRGFIADEGAVARVIQNAIANRGLKGSKVVAALPGVDSISRVISLPYGKDVDPEIAIPREVRRLTAVSLEENYLYWQALPQEEGSFFTLAVPKFAVDSLVRTLRMAGLKPVSFDTAPLALARAIDQSPAIIAHVELNSLDVIIIGENAPAVMRSHFSEESLSGDDADWVAGEIERTMSFYNTSRREPLPPEVPVYLSGSLSSNQEVARAVEEATGHSVYEAEPAMKLPEDFPKASMMVNIGLTMKSS
ncbi:MAG: type IV pilus biogenesis protein PilM [Chloroflexota bacterium]